MSSGGLGVATGHRGRFDTERLEQGAARDPILFADAEDTARELVLLGELEGLRPADPECPARRHEVDADGERLQLLHGHHQLCLDHGHHHPSLIKILLTLEFESAICSPSLGSGARKVKRFMCVCREVLKLLTIAQ